MSSDSAPPIEAGPYRVPTWARSERLWGWVAAALSGLLLVVAFPPFALPEAAYVWALPLLLWIYWASPPAPRLMLVSFLSGWGAWIGLIHWLRHFTEHLGFPGAALLGWFLTLALAAGVATFAALWFTLVSLALPRLRAPSVIGRCVVLLQLAAAWVVLEWLRGWLLTGFPWLPLAASQWQRPLVLQMAAVTGAWGLSFVLILFNLGLVFVTQRFVRRSTDSSWLRRMSPEMYLALGGLFFAIIFGVQSLSEAREVSRREPVFVAGLVQPYLPAQERMDTQGIEAAMAEMRRLSTYAAAGLGADILFWPEAPIPFPANDPDLREWFTGLSSELATPMIVGAIVRHETASGDAYWNAILPVEPATGPDLAQTYGKRHLVPFGEYFPLSDVVPYMDALVPSVGGFQAGTREEPLTVRVADRTWRLGPLVCYEDVYPQLARSHVARGADLLFVASSSVWYGTGPAMITQHAAHSVLRAIETRRPVIRCGNGGWSGWIDEYGYIRDEVADPLSSPTTARGAAFPIFRDRSWVGRPTLYVQRGDWFVIFASALTIPLLVRIFAGRARPAPTL